MITSLLLELLCCTGVTWSQTRSREGKARGGQVASSCSRPPLCEDAGARPRCFPGVLMERSFLPISRKHSRCAEKDMFRGEKPMSESSEPHCHFSITSSFDSHQYQSEKTFQLQLSSARASLRFLPTVSMSGSSRRSRKTSKQRDQAIQSPKHLTSLIKHSRLRL